MGESKEGEGRMEVGLGVPNPAHRLVSPEMMGR